MDTNTLQFVSGALCLLMLFAFIGALCMGLDRKFVRLFNYIQNECTKNTLMAAFVMSSLFGPLSFLIFRTIALYVEQSRLLKMQLLWEWEKGRQPSAVAGYKKFPLMVSKLFKFDIYLIRIPAGCIIPAHRDDVVIPGHDHHRVNIVLVKSPMGGYHYVDGPFKQWGPIIRFRPDIYKHTLVTPIGGDVLMLSVGWLSPRRLVSNRG